jgi:calcium-translocating P-type ATPase
MMDAGASATTARAAELEVVHSSWNRLRVHLRRWSGHGAQRIETRLGGCPGVRVVEANPWTRNILIIFDPVVTNEATLLQTLQAVPLNGTAPPTSASRPPLKAAREKQARIPVRGLDRDPQLARRLVKHLQHAHGIRALAKPLTGHILVQFDEHRVLFEEVLASVAHLELPGLPGDDTPLHPLDPLPLRQGILRVLGSILGLGYVTYRRLNAGGVAGTQSVLATWTASLLNLFQGLPPVRDGLQRLTDRNLSDLVQSGVGIFALALADSPLGLIVAGVEALILLGEVTARRSAWRRYEENLHGVFAAELGTMIRLEAGMRVPADALVVEGTGTAATASGLPAPLAPGSLAPAGAELAGGPFVLELQGGKAFPPQPRPAPPAPTLYDQYHRVGPALALALVGFAAFRTRSVVRTMETLLLLNPRTAVIARDVANLAAAARALRSGLTVVGSRPDRIIQLPDTLLLCEPRLLTDGLEVAVLLALEDPAAAPDVLALAAGVSTAAKSPWGNVFAARKVVHATEGQYNGLFATALVNGEKYYLGPPEDPPPALETYLSSHQGGYMLELRRYEADKALGFVALRPRIRPGVEVLAKTCQRLAVRLELLPGDSPVAARAVAWRAGLTLTPSADKVATIRQRQQHGALVAVVSDSAAAAEAFAACDLAIGLAHGYGGYFPARTDLLAPDLQAVADLLDTAAQRKLAVRDGVALSTVSNLVGAGLSLFGGEIGAERASWGVYFTALAAMGGALYRTRGGQRPESLLGYLVDPRPERWGGRNVVDVFRAFNSTDAGLTTMEAEARRLPVASLTGRDQLLRSLGNQIRTPILSILAGGACLTIVLGQPLNTALLGLTISINVAVGVWQEREVGRAADELRRLTKGVARVWRDGCLHTLTPADVVPGDVLQLAPGERVAADARLFSSSGLEVAEAALTGESLPVTKGPEESNPADRIVLEGTDIVAGTGRAVVVAVGRHTRMGATAAALNVERQDESPMGTRLGQILRLALPVAFGGGALAGLAGLVYGAAPVMQLTVGVTTALSAIPEGLPLMAGVGQAGVARRLSAQRAVVRRIAAIEALGRVDVVCTDKTGTLTEGRLALQVLADQEQEVRLPGTLSPPFRRLLGVAALASPPPDAPAGTTHPTDLSIVRAALEAGLGDETRQPRLTVVPFDSSRAFYAALMPGRICVKGAPERIIPRCTRLRVPAAPQLDPAQGEMRWEGETIQLDAAGRQALLDRGARLAERGLRVLLVAEGPADTNPYDPQNLTALGFLGISDPLRLGVRATVRRCQEAGVRLIILTGDHPSTARAIAAEAGLLTAGQDGVVRAEDLAGLSSEQLAVRLEGVVVVARATPLDKLRLIEGLQRHGHVVAMTGDGVNDAPSLRLADVGVAMGRSGTEVARQAADVVLADDEFATLVEALVEGRGFWRNMRNALALLLGGNVGEVGLGVGASLLGFGSPLNAAQILIVNMITDALPSLAVVLQRPHHRNLAGLSREGLSALDQGLRRDVIRRGVATGLPSLASFLLMQGLGRPAEAGSVAFTSVVATQLAQTLEVGRVEGTLSPQVVGAVAGSLGVLLATVLIPPLRDLLSLQMPSVVGWSTVAAASGSAVLLSRAVSALSTSLEAGAGDVHPLLGFQRTLSLTHQ